MDFLLDLRQYQNSIKTYEFITSKENSPAAEAVSTMDALRGYDLVGKYLSKNGTVRVS